jgi:hypothetical protein
MIAKRIKRKKTRDTFKRLAGYVLNEKNGGKADPVTWELAEYVLDGAHQGEKVAYWRVTNCGAEDPGFAVKEIIATQDRNTRSKSDKSYHLVISFPPGEQPTREQVEDIEDQLVASIGLQEHQRISAVHQNTDCWHLHVAINKVHPRTLRNVEPYYDQPRLQAACAEMEVKHNLTRTNHGLAPERPLNGKPAEMEAHAGRMSFHRWLIENAEDALVQGVAECSNWQEFHAVVARFGAVIKPRGAGLVIVHRDNDRIRVKPSSIDRSLSFKALTDRWGEYKPPPTRQEWPTQPIENVENGVDMSAGQTDAIPVTPLTVYDEGQADNAPLSEGGQRPPPTMVYTAEPIQADRRAQSLWQVYQRERRAAEQDREQAMNALRAGHSVYRKSLADWYRKRYRSARAAQLGKADRKDTFQHLRSAQRKDHHSRRVVEAQERKTVREDYPIPTWQGFLEREAENGNTEALAVLRSRQQRRERIERAIFAADDAHEATNVVHKRLRPIVRRDGTMIYIVADGGVVSDGPTEIAVTKLTTGAAYLALELASQRFNGRPVSVHGDDEFRGMLARLSGIDGVAVTFADAALEAMCRNRKTSVETEIERAHTVSCIAETGHGERDTGRT